MFACGLRGTSLGKGKKYCSALRAAVVLPGCMRYISINRASKMTMASKNNLFASLNVTKNARTMAGEDDNALLDLMANPEYLRHSSSIINDALKDGFDVLQLPNGDIVTTGTKIITNTYTWDAGKTKLVKARAASDKPRKSRKATEAESDDDSDE